MRYCAEKRLPLDVVGEAAPAVDLDDRDPLPVGRLQRGIARDVDLPQLELGVATESGEHLPRPLAEVAAGRRVEDDPRAGYG
jgi:hypothetical protein